MIPILALRAVLLASLGAVQALSVVPAGDRTAILIEVDGEVSYRHETLTSPPRIVVDISGAEFRLPQGRYLDINRGGVLALRSSQFEAGVVRVVVDLAESVQYDIEQAGGIIRISFPNPSGPFEAWSSSSAAPAGARVPTVQQPEGMLGQPVPAPDRPGVAVPVSQTPAAAVVQEPQQPPVWVEFRNTPIGDVLSHFADFSGRSIIPGMGVGAQTITASIQGQPWDEALDAILQGQGLVARELPSGIIMVTSMANLRQQETQEETVTRTFDIKYVDADSIRVQVQQLIQQGAQGQGGQGGTVAVNKATNTLIVSARQSVVDQITALIPALDRPTPQVTIQARILFVNRTQIEGLGVRYEIKDSRGTMLNRLTTGFIDQDGDGVFEPDEQTEDDVIDFSGNTISAVGNAAERIPSSTFEVVTTLILGRHSLITWLEAVERLNLSEVQAEPVVTVLDHRTARVQVGERTPIRVVDQGAGTAEGALTSSVTTEETGVILEVTPHVVGNQVRLQLHAERSLVLEASVDEGYRFGTQQTDTEILLDDGETAVISGLTITDYLEERAGIPILMNLPLVGALFRRTLEQEVKQDLLIMVTPYIERAGGM